MSQLNWCRRALTNQWLGVCVLLSVFVAVTSTQAKTFVDEESPHVLETSTLNDQTASKNVFLMAPEGERIKRNSETLQENVGRDYPEARDKKVPRRFLGIRGKKVPSSFLGMRGRRDNSGAGYPDEDTPFEGTSEEVLMKLSKPLEGGENVVHPLDILKRAPSGFLGMRGKKAPSGFLGMRGKKAPSGFLGMRGKKAPSGFLGMRGKKVPSGFLGMRGKKDYETYDDLEDVLQALRQRYNDQELYEQDKRAPRGFLGMRGKKFDVDAFDDDYYLANQEPLFPNAYNDVSDDVINEKRAPSGFLGMRG